MFAVIGENRGERAETRLDISLNFGSRKIVDVGLTDPEKVILRKGGEESKKIKISVRDLNLGEQHGAILIVEGKSIKKFKAKSYSTGKEVPILYYRINF